MAGFQVKLSGEWKTYEGQEDKILKRAYLAGHPTARYQLRGQKYEIDFKNMKQKNARSGKERDIRPPHKWKPPAAPIVPKGPSMCIKVPEGTAGTEIQVPHPKAKDEVITVAVPASAKPGQAMLVPVPAPGPAAPSAPPGEPAAATAEKSGGGGWTTGQKVAAGAAGVALAGGVVAGAVLGEHIMEDGWDATMEDLGADVTGAADDVAGAAADAGEAIGDVADDAADWVGDAADTAGDFIMDLF